MNNTNYLIEFEDYENKSISQLIQDIRLTEGIKLNDLKVKDLTYYHNEIINPGLGVYIFKLNNTFFHIGKVRSNSFTERIPKHFDIRPKSWFNRLLFITCREYYNIPLDNSNYIKASDFVFNNLSLVLLNIKNIDKIDTIEKIMRSNTETLNKFKYKKYDESLILSSL